MRIQDLMTPEENAYMRLTEEAEEVFSAAAVTVIGETEAAAYADHLICTNFLMPEDYEEATERMRLAAAKLTDREHELLGRLWRAALAAAASIDPSDRTPVASFRAYQGDFHWYYRVLSGMVEKVLGEGREVSQGRNPGFGRPFGCALLMRNG